MDVISGGAKRRDTRLVPILALLGLLLAAAVAAAYVGSRPPATDLTAVPPADATSTPSASAPAATATPNLTLPPPSPNAEATITLPHRTLELVKGDDAMYVSIAGEDTNELLRSVYRIDPATNEATLVVDEVPAGPSDHLSFVQRAGSIWVGHHEGDRILRFDEATGQALGEVAVGTRPIEPIVAFGDVWSQDYDDGSATRVDAETGEVVTTILIPQFEGRGPRHMAPGTDALWAITPHTSTMVGIDPETNTISREVAIGPQLHCGVAVKEGQIWVAGCDSPLIEVYDEATGQSLGNVELRAGLPLPAPAPGIWLPSLQNDPARTLLVPINPSTLVPSGDAPDLGAAAGFITVAFDSIWFNSGTNVYRLPLDVLGG